MSQPPIARTRAHVNRLRSFAPVVVVLVALAIAIAASSAPAPAVAAPGDPADTLPAVGKRWFALGANVPYLRWRCDFGCGQGRGVRGNRDQVDRMLREMSRRGVRVVRWYLFPGNAWQVQRSADGMPRRVARGALLDLDMAVALAEKHDVFLVPVVLPSPGSVPPRWFTDRTHAQALAAALRPMFARYHDERHVLGWELATRGDHLVDRGTATRAQVRDQVVRLRRALRQVSRKLASAGPTDVSRIDLYTRTGLDYYAPHYVTGMAGERCATCRATSSLVTGEGLDRPVVIGGFDARSGVEATRRLNRFARYGYAGALAWSWRGVAHPERPTSAARMPQVATWRYHHAHPGSGPRTRPLNPCLGPQRSDWRCPNLQMSRPRSVSLGRIGSRAVLYSTNSLDSVGRGPASLHGRRTGRYTMAAVQLLHRRGGGRPLRVRTGAKLQFKAIPGQSRYWKWNGAARMELWRLDSAGTPVQRVRVGPKTVYCLRDLSRTNGWLPGAPGGRVYPGCSQNPSQRSVTLGTSVGWSDVYPASYHENWIPVGGLRGCFAYVHVADPDDVIYESNEDDNASSVVVRLPWTGSNRGCPGTRPIPTTGTNGGY